MLTYAAVAVAAATVAAAASVTVTIDERRGSEGFAWS